MLRVTKSNIHNKYRKRIFQLVKKTGINYKLTTSINEQLLQSFSAAYKGRKLKKRTFRRFWIYSINANTYLSLFKYSQVMHKLRVCKILLNRKVLSILIHFDYTLYLYLLNYINNYVYLNSKANIAQSVVQLICNQQVKSSNLFISKI